MAEQFPRSIAPWARTLRRLDGVHHADTGRTFRPSVATPSPSSTSPPKPKPSSSSSPPTTPSAPKTPQNTRPPPAFPTSGVSKSRRKKKKKLRLQSTTLSLLSSTSPGRPNPFVKLPLEVVARIVGYLSPGEFVSGQRVCKQWRVVLASEYMYTMALRAHFRGSKEEKEVTRLEEQRGEKWPEESVEAYRRAVGRVRSGGKETEEEEAVVGKGKKVARRRVDEVSSPGGDVKGKGKGRVRRKGLEESGRKPSFLTAPSIHKDGETEAEGEAAVVAPPKRQRAESEQRVDDRRATVATPRTRKRKADDSDGQPESSRRRRTTAGSDSPGFPPPYTHAGSPLRSPRAERYRQREQRKGV